MSCSSSSNILSNVTSVDIRRIGSKILATIPKTSSDYTVEAGITAGDVIRYDVTDASSKIYRKSKADNIENAEVVGVVETANSVSLNVVIFGQIQFPSGRFNNEGTPEGASGGNDIYFLSSSTSGDVTSLAPSEPTQVVKPILQRMDDGTNNAVVLNYIGYVVGGEVSANDLDETLTTIIEYVDVGQNLPSNLLKVSDSSKVLLVTDYRDLYKVIGKMFGYKEKLTFDSTTSKIS